MRRKLKKFLSKKLPRIFWITFLFIFIFMANGYAILKTRFDINGNVVIDREEWEPTLKIIKTSQIENVFFYEINIENRSKLTCYEWELKIEDTGVISFPFGIYAEKQGKYWVISSSSWDTRIESGGKVVFNITFEVQPDLDNSMTVTEYADYFVKNCITIYANMEAQGSKEGEIASNGNAKLVLNKNETEVTDYKLEKNKNYTPTEPTKKQYILTIYNKSDTHYSKIRANIYFGSAELIGVIPSEILCVHSDNATFHVPIEIQIGSEEAASIYITIDSKDTNFEPDIVIVAS